MEILPYNRKIAKNLKIRAALQMAGLNMSRYARLHNFSYTALEKVVNGDLGKYESPVTKAFKIRQQLKSDGFWFDDEAPE